MGGMSRISGTGQPPLAAINASFGLAGRMGG
jgi:hypothetical protein